MRSHLANIWIVAALIGSLVIGPVKAIADDETDASRQDLTQWRVDMPSQSVDEAIYRLGVVTGVQIFADGAIIAGRRAKAISGIFTAKRALTTLLAGTGLVSRSTGGGSLIVTEAESGPKADRLRRDYSIDLQRTVVAALCRAPDIYLGNYRLALRMWITEQGRAEHVDLLSSTGDDSRDRRILDTLRALSARHPPEVLPQPVIMVILPRLPQDSGDCGPDRAPPAGVDTSVSGAKR